MAVVKLGFDTAWVAHNHLYPAGHSLLDRVARQVAPALGWRQAPGTTETGRNTPSSVGVTRQNGN